MKIKFRVSKIANQFFFISTLAAWHYSCRKEDREEWLHMTGKLSVEEEKALTAFSYLMKTKYGFQDKRNYLGEIFYKHTESTIWTALKKFVKKQKDYKFIKDVFTLFENRFEKAWRERMLSSLKILKDEIKKENVVEFLNIASSLFGDRKTMMNPIIIIILFSPLTDGRTAAGSANLRGNFITLELPMFKKNTWQLSYSLTILGHELAHMYFKKRGGDALLRSAMKKINLKKKYDILPINTLTILNEIITAAFVPLGALGQKYFSTNLSHLLFSKMPKIIALEQLSNKKTLVPYYGHLEYFFIWKLFPLSMEYAQNKKQIDKTFINRATFILRKFVG